MEAKKLGTMEEVRQADALGSTNWRGVLVSLSGALRPPGSRSKMKEIFEFWHGVILSEIGFYMSIWL